MSLDDLKAFLSEIPAIKHHVNDILEKNRIEDIIKLIPTEVMENFYLSKSFSDADSEMHKWCREHITNPSDFISVMKHFKIRPYYQPKGL